MNGAPAIGLPGVLREKFSIGLTGNRPFSKTLPLDRILGYHLATIGTSHFTSVIDVILGSLRYAVNMRKENRPVAKVLINQLAALCILESCFVRLTEDPKTPGPFVKVQKASDLSINFSPKTIKVGKYLDQYKELCCMCLPAGKRH
jgi:hypothetical protein